MPHTLSIACVAGSVVQFLTMAAPGTGDSAAAVTVMALHVVGPAPSASKRRFTAFSYIVLSTESNR